MGLILVVFGFLFLVLWLLACVCDLVVFYARVAVCWCHLFDLFVGFGVFCLLYFICWWLLGLVWILLFCVLFVLVCLF